MNRKYNIEKVRKIFEEGTACKLLSDKYENSQQKFDYICSCGNISKTTLYRFKNGTRCPKCGREKTANKKRRSLSEVQTIFQENGCYLKNNKYNNSSQKLDYICSCGNHSITTLNTFRQGHRCRKCGNKKRANEQRRSLSTVQQIFRKQKCILLTTVYKNTEQKLDYICSCGNYSKIRLSQFEQGQRCRKCGIKKYTEKSRYAYSEVKNIFKKGGCFLKSKEYKSSSHKLEYICSCGNHSQITLGNFIQGHRCQSCGVKKAIKKMSGTNHFNYNHNLTKEERLIQRNYPEYRTWHKKVKIRDNYTCQYCSTKGGKLHSHHVFSYSTHKELRTDINNGITFCEKCHKLFHKIYKNGNNTRQQLEEFLNNNKNSSIISVAS